MVAEIDKERIFKRFRKSLSTYNQHAIIQKQIAEKLCALLYQKTMRNFSSILEIGCGTGFLTDEILKKFNPEIFNANDIVSDVRPEIEKICSVHNVKNLNFIEGDAEIIQFPDRMDLIISGSVFQWMQDLPAFLKKMRDIMISDGIIAFSTFGKQNFYEIKHIADAGLHYFSVNELECILQNDFTIIHLEQNIEKVYFEHPLDVLKHIKYTGVNGTSDTVWCKTALTQFENEYNRKFRMNNKVPLTYHPIYIIAKAK